VFRRSTESAVLHDLCGELDATKLATSCVLEKFRQECSKLPLFIWFQCPWTFEDEQKYSTAELLTKLIDAASKLIHPGGIVLVLGLVSKYDKVYEIQDLIQAANAKGFRHLEAKNFIRECILYGYRQCVWDGTDRCHKYYLNHHVSHIFIKKKEGRTQSGGA